MNIQSLITETTAPRLIGHVGTIVLAGIAASLLSRSCSAAVAGLGRYYPTITESVKRITNYAVHTPFYTAIFANLGRSGAILILASIITECCPLLLPFTPTLLGIAIACWIHLFFQPAPKTESIDQKKDKRTLKILKAVSELKEVSFPASLSSLNKYEIGDGIAEVLANKLSDLEGDSLKKALDIFVKLFGTESKAGYLSEEGEKIIIDAVRKTLKGELLWGTLARLVGTLRCPVSRTCIAEGATKLLHDLEGVSLKNVLSILAQVSVSALNLDENLLADTVLKKLSPLKDDDLKNAFQILFNLVRRKCLDQKMEDSIAKTVLEKLPDLEGEIFSAALSVPIILLAKAFRAKTMRNDVAGAVINILPKVVEKKTLATILLRLSSLKEKNLVSEEIGNLITAAKLKYNYDDLKMTCKDIFYLGSL